MDGRGKAGITVHLTADSEYSSQLSLVSVFDFVSKSRIGLFSSEFSQNA